jgi:hypothetical protein
MLSPILSKDLRIELRSRFGVARTKALMDNVIQRTITKPYDGNSIPNR